LTDEWADSDLESQVRRLDPDRWLASRFVADPVARGDLIALFSYDHELGRAPRRASNPLVGEIRLTWWREALDEVFGDRPVRKHPTAIALADTIRRRSLPREPLEAMIDARLIEVDGGPADSSQAIAWADGVGGGWMRAAALILDPATPESATTAAGRAWGLRHWLTIEGAEPAREAALKEARTAVRGLSVAAFPVALALTAQKPGGDLTKRLRLTWSAATGRI
jgi:phytoene synthase